MELDANAIIEKFNQKLTEIMSVNIVLEVQVETLIKELEDRDAKLAALGDKDKPESTENNTGKYVEHQ